MFQQNTTSYDSGILGKGLSLKDRENVMKSRFYILKRTLYSHRGIKMLKFDIFEGSETHDFLNFEQGLYGLNCTLGLLEQPDKFHKIIKEYEKELFLAERKISYTWY